MDALFSSIVSAGWGIQSPLLLLVLLFIFIPIAIHLFNKSRGKIVPIGDIRFVNVKAFKKMTEIKLVERLLLVNRLLILILITLILAQLFVHLGNSNTSAGKHILVTEDWLSVAGTDEKSTLMALLNEPDHTVNLLSADSGQPRSLTKIHIDSADQITGDALQAVDLWHQVNSYANDIGDGEDISVYATNRLSQFVGSRTKSDMQVDWQVKEVPLEDSEIELSEPIDVLLLSSPNRAVDINYLSAALSSLKNSLLPGLNVDNITLDAGRAIKTWNESLSEADIVFYLSDIPPKNQILNYIKSGGTLILDAVSQQQRAEAVVNAHIDIDKPAYPTLYQGFSLNYVGIPHEIEEIKTNTENQILWKTEAGAALLLENHFGNGRVLFFYSRFNPAWSDWVRLRVFPHDLAGLVVSKNVISTIEKINLRNGRLSPEQISYRNQASQYPSNSALTKVQGKNSFVDDYLESTKNYLGLLLIIFFCFERVLSEITASRKDKTPSKVSDDVEVS